MVTKVFKNGNSKAVRLPASLGWNCSEVELVDLGEEGILLKPLKSDRDPWNLFREGLAEINGEWPERTQELNEPRKSW